jgi:hypothetical protein
VDRSTSGLGSTPSFPPFIHLNINFQSRGLLTIDKTRVAGVCQHLNRKLYINYESPSHRMVKKYIPYSRSEPTPNRTGASCMKPQLIADAQQMWTTPLQVLIIHLLSLSSCATFSRFEAAHPKTQIRYQANIWMMFANLNRNYVELLCNIVEHRRERHRMVKK